MKKLTKYVLIAALLVLPYITFAAGAFQPPIGGGTTSPQSFVPLTNIPGVLEQGTAPTLPFFLNGIYKLAIGLGAALAVLQIIRAGIMYMSGDSFTEKKEARGMIGLSIGGLLLLLSPYIVFSIINPSILNLSLSFDDLQSAPANFEGTVVISVSSADECTSKGGTVTGDALAVTCTVPSNSPAGKAATSCTNFKDITPVAGTCFALAGEDYGQINDTCCPNLAEGSICCAKAPEQPVTLPDMSRTVSVTFYSIEGAFGEHDDHGTLAADQYTYDIFTNACTSGNNLQKKTGIIKKAYQDKIAKQSCTQAQLDAFTQAGVNKEILQCIPATISCTLN